MTITVDYDAGHAYIGGRPIMPCRLHGPGGSYGSMIRFTAFVDTGADQLTLLMQLAQRVGIVVAGAQPVRVLGATGATTVQRTHVDVTFDLLGLTTRVKCDFFPNAIPLVGLEALWQIHSATGFDAGQWLHMC